MSSLLKSTRDINKPSGDTPQAQRQKVQSSESDMPDVPTWPGTSTQNVKNQKGAPVQGGGVASSGGGLASGSIVETTKTYADADVSPPVMENQLQQLMMYMKQQDQKRDEQHNQIVTSITGLATTTSELKTAIETEKSQRESEVNELRAKIESVEKRMDNFKPPGIGGDEDDETARQIIARGFDRDTDAADIIKTLENFLASNERNKYVVEVSTFTDPASIGVITFSSAAAKNGFWRKIRDHGVKLSNDRMLKFESNESFEVRTRNQALTQIKFQMVQMLKYDAKDVKILRKTGEVKLKSEKVAEVKADATMVFTDTTKDIKETVENHMKEWIDKRTKPRE